MKVHTKKKAYRAMVKQLARDGFINLENGHFVARNQAADNSMKRDYFPQRG